MRVQPGIKLIAEHLKSLRSTNGMMLTENGKLRPFTENEYFVFNSDLKMGLKPTKLLESNKKFFENNEYKIYISEVSKYTGKRLTESTKRKLRLIKEISNFKISNLLIESDVMDKKIKNPETGRDVKVATALGNPDHPAHDKAKSMVDKGKDDHGDGHDDHGHHDDGLSAKEKAVLGGVDVALKALHVPGLDKIAGQSEAIYKGMKEVVGSAKEAKGFLGKAKAMGSAAKKMIGNMKDKVAKDFANSITDENTGQRKKIGQIIKEKAIGLGKAVVKGIKEEAKHIAHELKDGAEGIKEIIKDPSKIKDPATQKKLATGLKGLCTTAVVGMAVASGPAGMAMKAASLAVNPGDGVAAMLTSSVYSDLQRQGRLKIIESEHKIHRLYRLIENKIDKIDDNFMLDVYQKFGSRELEKVTDPLNSYDERGNEDMVRYTQMSADVQEGLGR